MDRGCQTPRVTLVLAAACAQPGSGRITASGGGRAVWVEAMTRVTPLLHGERGGVPAITVRVLAFVSNGGAAVVA